MELLEINFLLLNSNRLKPFYKGMITNRLVTVPLVPGLYLVSTYRSGGYKISSLSIVNIQAQDGSFIETLVKGVDYDNTIEMKYTDSNISFQYKIDLSGGCTIVDVDVSFIRYPCKEAAQIPSDRIHVRY